jgi:pyruvyl transferase EpsO
MAFSLGTLPRPHPARKRIVWLARGDKESVHAAVAAEDTTIADWDDEPRTRLMRLNRRLTDAAMRPPQHLGRALFSRRFWREFLPRDTWRSLAMRTYEPLARERLARGMSMLSDGEAVITDRLHGHILSMLLGIPHVILDNSYGKLSSFHDRWTKGLPGVHFASSPDEAVAIARAQ